MATLDRRRSARPWHARVRQYGRSVGLGSFATEAEAVAAEERERSRYRAEVRREIPERASWRRYA